VNVTYGIFAVVVASWELGVFVGRSVAAELHYDSDSCSNSCVLWVDVLEERTIVRYKANENISSISMELYCTFI
jgi:hypothetical protein